MQRRSRTAAFYGVAIAGFARAFVPVLCLLPLALVLPLQDAVLCCGYVKKDDALGLMYWAIDVDGERRKASASASASAMAAPSISKN